MASLLSFRFLFRVVSVFLLTGPRPKLAGKIVQEPIQIAGLRRYNILYQKLSKLQQQLSWHCIAVSIPVHVTLPLWSHHQMEAGQPGHPGDNAQVRVARDYRPVGDPVQTRLQATAGKNVQDPQSSIKTVFCNGVQVMYQLLPVSFWHKKD